MRTSTPYDQAYPTCSYTHAWLRVMGENLDVDEVTQLLGTTPTKTQNAGDPVPWKAKPGTKLKYSGWTLSTEGTLSSLDVRHHLDWILEKVQGKREAFDILRSRGFLVDICCRWDSVRGDGGPTLWPKQMSEIAQLGIELWFDLYFDAPSKD